MRPFVQHVNNQHLTSPPPSNSTPQQAPGNSNNMLMPQMGFVNPFDNNNNTNFNGNNGFMNIPNFNAHLGTAILGSAQQNQSNNPGFSPNNFNVFGFPGSGQLNNLGHSPLNNNGQFGWQNQLQNMNLPMLNHSQVNALTQLLGCANQVAQAMNPQNTAFLGNPQLGFGQPNAGLQQPGFGQQLPMGSHQLQNVSVPPSNHVALSLPHGQPLNSQGNHGQHQGMHIPNSSHHQNKNFVNPKRDAPNWRNQKPQDRHMHNPKGKLKFPNTNEGKGIKNVGPDNSGNQSQGGKRRSLALLYTEKEIQQWREERKKNFPSKGNVEKKLAEKQANADAADEDAKIRRQQLKDVLAKQVELGFEVPEIPSHYLLDPEHQAHGRDKSRRPLSKGRFPNNGRFQNKFNRGKFDNKDRFNTKRGTEDDGSYRKHDRFPKRQRMEDDNAPKTPSIVKEPTLLQKLLSTDIKKDQTRLLQAFRFMVINSFFKDWPETTLNFPKVIVREIGVESDVIDENSSFIKGDLSNDEDPDTSDEKNGPNDGPQEEGEITD